MTSNHTLQSDKRVDMATPAITAGISLILMFLISIFAFGFAHSSLIVYDNPALTLANILSSRPLFQAEIGAWTLIIFLDLIVTWAFYSYLKPIDRNYAFLSGLLRLAYTCQLAYAVSKLILAASIAGTGSGSAALVYDQVMHFESIWSLGLIVFGLHLTITGLTAIKTESIPRVISLLLIITGLSYMLLHAVDTFFPQLKQMKSTAETILMLPMIVGELGFGIWLLVKGREFQI